MNNAEDVTPTVSASDHIVYETELSALNTEYKKAVSLPAIELFYNDCAMSVIVDYVKAITNFLNPNEMDVTGKFLLQACPDQDLFSDFKLFRPERQWELQFMILYLIYLLPNIRTDIFCDAPNCVDKHFMQCFESEMSRQLFGLSHDKKTLVCASTPLEITQYMLTRLKQSYYNKT